MDKSEIEFEVLKRASGKLSQRGIANEVGYSLGKVNYVLKKLVEKGLVKIERFSNSKNKSQYRYLLTEKGIKEKIAITEKFIKRKKEEYEELQADLKKYEQNNQLRVEN